MKPIFFCIISIFLIHSVFTLNPVDLISGYVAKIEGSANLTSPGHTGNMNDGCIEFPIANFGYLSVDDATLISAMKGSLKSEFTFSFWVYNTKKKNFPSKKFFKKKS